MKILNTKISTDADSGFTFLFANEAKVMKLPGVWWIIAFFIMDTQYWKIRKDYCLDSSNNATINNFVLVAVSTYLPNILFYLCSKKITDIYGYHSWRDYIIASKKGKNKGWERKTGDRNNCHDGSEFFESLKSNHHEYEHYKPANADVNDPVPVYVV